MSERKSWSEEEDKALKELYEVQGMRRWAEIARVMEKQFRLRGRSGKQCRQRYYNHLDKSIKQGQWNPQEEKELMDRHENVGNRWAEIARSLPGRSQNCVKNKFYSIIRRGLRCINKAIKTSLKKYNQIDISTVFKIVEACEASYKRKTLNKEMMQLLQIKKGVVHYGLNPQQCEPDLNPRVKSLIDKIKAFGKQSPKKVKEAVKEEEESSDIEASEKEEEDFVTSAKVKQPQPQGPSIQSMSDYQSIVQTQIQPQVHYPPMQMTRRESFKRVVSPSVAQPQDKAEQKDFCYPVTPGLVSLVAQSGRQPQEMNYFDRTPREGGLLDGNWTVRSFEIPQFENMRSPRPLGNIESPYFDQLRGTSFNSFNPIFPQ